MFIRTLENREDVELLEWEQVYNTVRPHQALGYLTPLKFLEQRKDYKKKEVMCH
ncbi:integrase core domain-containing protein [Chloroflexota bacterium]